MSSSSAISGGIGNSGISVDELVYLEWDISMPTPFDGAYLVLYVKYMQTFCKTWLGISLKLTWKKSWAIGRRMLSTSFVSFSANCPGPESIALMVPEKIKWIFQRPQSLVSSVMAQPEVRAWSLETMNSCPSELMSLTYLIRRMSCIQKARSKTVVEQITLHQGLRSLQRFLPHHLRPLQSRWQSFFPLCNCNQLEMEMICFFSITVEGVVGLLQGSIRLLCR